jgi:hypothetical protein
MAEKKYLRLQVGRGVAADKEDIEEQAEEAVDRGQEHDPASSQARPPFSYSILATADAVFSAFTSSTTSGLKPEIPRPESGGVEGQKRHRLTAVPRPLARGLRSCGRKAGWSEPAQYLTGSLSPLACWSIEITRRCSSHITASAFLPVTFPMPPATKLLDLSETWR